MMPTVTGLYSNFIHSHERQDSMRADRPCSMDRNSAKQNQGDDPRLEILGRKWGAESETETSPFFQR